MKLQLLSLVAIVTTVIALPAPKRAINTFEKRAEIDGTYKTLGKVCEVANVEGRKATATGQEVSLFCRRKMFSTTISLVTDPFCCK